MEPRHLYTVRWTQPYATSKQRPFLREQQLMMESLVEKWLDTENSYPEAEAAIERIMKL